MEIAIIGCGYVGKALAQAWKKAGHSITATTRSKNRVEELMPVADRVIVLEGDLFHFFSTALAMHEVIVLSVAADSHSPQNYESAYLQTANALGAAAAKLPFLRQIIYTSSTSIYGDQNGNWVDETTPPIPTNRNSQILLETEQVLEKAETSKRQVCIYRLGEIYGPGREFSNRLQSLNGRPLPGSGGNYTNIIHLHDIVGAIDFALCKHLNGIYNLCNDVHMLRQELYDRICEKKGFPKVVWDPAIRGIHAGNKRVSNAKLKSAGYRFQADSFP